MQVGSDQGLSGGGAGVGLGFSGKFASLELEATFLAVFLCHLHTKSEPAVAEVKSEAVDLS